MILTDLCAPQPPQRHTRCCGKRCHILDRSVHHTLKCITRRHCLQVLTETDIPDMDLSEVIPKASIPPGMTELGLKAVRDTAVKHSDMFHCLL